MRNIDIFQTSINKIIINDTWNLRRSIETADSALITARMSNRCSKNSFPCLSENLTMCVNRASLGICIVLTQGIDPVSIRTAGLVVVPCVDWRHNPRSFRDTPGLPSRIFPGRNWQRETDGRTDGRKDGRVCAVAKVLNYAVLRWRHLC